MILYYKGMPVVIREDQFNQKNVLIILDCEDYNNIEVSYLQKFSRGRKSPTFKISHKEIIPILYFGKYFTYKFKGGKIELSLDGESIKYPFIKEGWDIIRSRNILMSRNDDVLKNLITYERNLPYKTRKEDSMI